MRVLITGTSKGIGRAMIEQFNKLGLEVVAITRGDRVEILKRDTYIEVTFDWSSYDDLAEALVGRFGKESIGYVVNNAAMLDVASLEELSRKSFIDHMEVNVWYVLELFRALNRKDLFQEKAHHISIGSMGGVQGTKKFPGLAAYSMSKAALAGLMESMVAEFGSTGMSFNCLALGAVNTEMLRSAFPGYISEVGPSDMAKFIATFSVNARGLMNGQIISVANSDPEG